MSYVTMANKEGKPLFTRELAIDFSDLIDYLAREIGEGHFTCDDVRHALEKSNNMEDDLK